MLQQRGEEGGPAAGAAPGHHALQPADAGERRGSIRCRDLQMKNGGETNRTGGVRVTTNKEERRILREGGLALPLAGGVVGRVGDWVRWGVTVRVGEWAYWALLFLLGCCVTLVSRLTEG